MGGEHGRAPQSVAYSWYVVVVLALTYTCSFLDRQVLNLLVEPIKRDLGLSDTQISLLQGASFAVLISICGVPIGRWVDRGRRVSIITAGVAFWSLMTAACGLAVGFFPLMLCRMGVAVGEASLTPAAYSIIGDYHPPQRRGLALGLYSLGVYFGSGLALIAGAGILSFLGTSVDIPLVGTVKPWQALFIYVGLPGLLMALWVATLREPARTETLRADAGVVPMVEVMAFFRTNAMVLGCLIFGFSFASLASYGLMAWVPSFFIRTFKWTAIEIGGSYGLINLIAGTAGVIFGGMLGDWLTARRVRGGRVIAMMCAALGAAICAGAAPLMENPRVALALLAPTSFFITIIVAIAPASLQDIVPNEMRGLTASVALLVVGLIGLGCGPTAIAVVTDYILRDESLIRYSLSLVPAVALLVAVVLFALAKAPYAASVIRRNA